MYRLLQCVEGPHSLEISDIHYLNVEIRDIQSNVQTLLQCVEGPHSLEISDIHYLNVDRTDKK